MNYYQISPNPASKIWKGYENPCSDLLNNGEELDELFLGNTLSKWNFGKLEYINLSEGKIAPINSIGATFILINANIPNVNSLTSPGLQLFPVNNHANSHKYLVMNAYERVDCVDWDKSEVDKWPEGHVLREWHNKRGRFFLNPVLIKDKIPGDLDAFRLQEWDSAYNIVISENLKAKIDCLEFDKSFLIFKQLEVN